MTLHYRNAAISFGKYNSNFQFIQCIELGIKNQHSLTNESDSLSVRFKEDLHLYQIL